MKTARLHCILGMSCHNWSTTAAVIQRNQLLLESSGATIYQVLHLPAWICVMLEAPWPANRASADRTFLTSSSTRQGTEHLSPVCVEGCLYLGRTPQVLKVPAGLHSRENASFGGVTFPALCLLSFFFCLSGCRGRPCREGGVECPGSRLTSIYPWIVSDTVGAP